MLKAYFWLTKPGIIVGNLITATGGFMLASHKDVDVWLLLATLAGTSLVIASGCVFNNYIDRGIDKMMARTKNRALVKGRIPVPYALAYGAALGILGFVTLGLFTNALTVWVGLLGLFFYVVMYGVWKRRSTFGTVVGSVAGAAPILAGYVAVSNEVDTAAILLFLILALWQMPHFYAIAMYRLRDYRAAGLPVMPVKHGNGLTKQYILFYIAAFLAAMCALTTFGYTGLTYLIVMLTLGSVWLWKGFTGLNTADDTAWARMMFRFSLRVIIVFSLLISIDAWLP